MIIFVDDSKTTKEKETTKKKKDSIEFEFSFKTFANIENFVYKSQKIDWQPLLINLPMICMFDDELRATDTMLKI